MWVQLWGRTSWGRTAGGESNEEDEVKYDACAELAFG